MSLYNNIKEGMAGGNLLGGIRTSINTAIGSAANSAVQALGGGALAQRVGGMGATMAGHAANGLINKHIPQSVQNALNVGAGAVSDLARGDWNSAGLRLLDSGMLDKHLPGFGGGVAAQAAYWGRPTPLLGGISPTEAKRIYDELRGHKLAKKNLWLIEVSSALRSDASLPFNLFATELEYAPFIVEGDKKRIGGAVVDVVQGAGPVELRLTTMDDSSGTIKKWFAAHHGAVAARDGTVGTPAQYAIKIRVVHSFVTTGSNRGGYEDIGLFRPSSLDVSLSRREDGLQEVQMTFSQLDTFMRP